MDFNISTLFASLIWGSIGFGFLIYGKRQRSLFPFIGGVALLGLSYFVSSAMYMSLAGIGVIAGIYFVTRSKGN